MKLVTYDDGKVGRVEGEEIVRLDVPTMREYFEHGGAEETRERVPLVETRLRAPIVPRKLIHTAGNFREHEDESKRVDWSHEIAPWIVFFQNIDAIIGPEDPVVYPSHLTNELDHAIALGDQVKDDDTLGTWLQERRGRIGTRRLITPRSGESAIDENGAHQAYDAQRFR